MTYSISTVVCFTVLTEGPDARERSSYFVTKPWNFRQTMPRILGKRFECDPIIPRRRQNEAALMLNLFKPSCNVVGVWYYRGERC